MVFNAKREKLKYSERKIVNVKNKLMSDNGLPLTATPGTIYFSSDFGGPTPGDDQEKVLRVRIFCEMSVSAEDGVSEYPGSICPISFQNYVHDASFRGGRSF
jgi:hypothetical protein